MGCFIGRKNKLLKCFIIFYKLVQNQDCQYNSMLSYLHSDMLFTFIYAMSPNVNTPCKYVDVNTIYNEWGRDKDKIKVEKHHGTV